MLCEVALVARRTYSHRLVEKNLAIIGIIDNHQPLTTILLLKPLFNQQQHIHFRVIITWDPTFLRYGKVRLAKSLSTARVDPEDRNFQPRLLQPVDVR